MSSSSLHALLELACVDLGQQVVDALDQRRGADDPMPAVDDLGQPGKRPRAVLLARLRGRAAGRLDGDASFGLVEHVVEVHPRVPDVEVPHRGEAPHRLAVPADRGEDGRPALPGREAAIAPADLDARGEPLDVPLPRPLVRLVEVVEVEDEPAVGGGEDAEVRQVRVAAELGGDAGRRATGEIGGHDRRGAAEERERRGEHPAVADRDELGHPRRGLLLQDRDRVGPVGGGLPLGVAAAWSLAPRGLAGGLALGAGGRRGSRAGWGAGGGHRSG